MRKVIIGVALLGGLAAAILGVVSLGSSVRNYTKQPKQPGVLSSTHVSSPPVKTLVLRPPLIGAYERGSPPSWEPDAQFAAAAHVHLSLALTYLRWGGGFQTAFARLANSHGAALLIQIQPFGASLDAIARGDYDGWLRLYARHCRYYGQRIVIGFGHEMNGSWFPWGYTHQSAASFVAAWRHIVEVFRQERASNVTWLWTVASSRAGAVPVKEYWPGASYVTWVGVDGYYYQRSDSFSLRFGRVISQVRKITDKPILLSEVGIGQVAGQAAKMPNLFAGIRRQHLLGLVWFDVAQHQGLFHQNWQLEGDHAGMVAFRRGVESLQGR